MIKIHLLIDEDYIDTFMTTIPKDKVIVIEEKFEENRDLLQNELNLYNKDNSSFSTYSQSMKKLDVWLEDKK